MTPFLVDGPAYAPATLLLAHGAGAPMASPFMATIAEGLAATGLRVLRFEFPYMAARRTTGAPRPPDREPVLRDAWHEVVSKVRRQPPRALFIGGKSLGGRIASLVADELAVDGLVCLGYPFHPPGQAEKLRTAHLAELRTPALIVQGTRDPFGGREEVVGYALAPTIRIHWIDDGDHSFVPRKSSGRNEAQNLAAAVAAVARFVSARYETADDRASLRRASRNR